VRFIFDEVAIVGFTLLLAAQKPCDNVRDWTLFADGRHVFIPERRRKEDSAKKPLLLLLSCVIQFWLCQVHHVVRVG
jgi:hypothetical protein